MAALINALDNHTTKQFGENGHAEYAWSNGTQEKILQLSFQLTRTNEEGVNKLRNVLSDLLNNLSHRLKTATLPEKELIKGHLSMLYRMVGHTRDIIDGKGEYTLTYMMIYTWNQFFPVLAKFALKCLVDLGDKTIHQYGSWKDLKYFCEYCKTQGATVDHPLVQYSIELINTKLREDSIATNDISLVAKWVPREKSSFGWIYEALACDYFKEFMATANTHERQTKAVLKCKTSYRKLLAELNRKIDTTQIKQCGQNWKSIDFNRVTSITVSKQKKAFLNVKKDGSDRHPDNQDRTECAVNFKSRIKAAAAGEVEMKGKRVGMADFTKQAFELIARKNTLKSGYNTTTTEDKENLQLETDLLNSQWRDNSTQTGALGKMIPMVDVSGSMSGDPMHVAIALGIRIAEKSVIGKRVMTFSAKPTWVNLEGYKDFVEQVDHISKADWGMNTNLMAAFDNILDVIIENKMSPEEVQDMILVILSDMQIDAGDSCDKTALYDAIKAKYAAAGIRVHGVPYKPPHILFWNLRSTSGFPSLSNQPNVSMMAGFSAALLNLFCEKGLVALQSCNPWGILEQILQNERYKIMAEKLDQEI